MNAFTVKRDIIDYGKAYAFTYSRERVGTIRALILLWIALNMIKHQKNQLTFGGY